MDKKSRLAQVSGSVFFLCKREMNLNCCNTPTVPCTPQNALERTVSLYIPQTWGNPCVSDSPSKISFVVPLRITPSRYTTNPNLRLDQESWFDLRRSPDGIIRLWGVFLP